MKITFFIGGLGSGGAEHVVAELANYLSVDHEVTILTWSNSKTHYYLEERVKLYPLRTCISKNKWLRNINSYKNLINYVTTIKTDCYLAFLPITVFLILSLKKKISVPIIFSIRNYPPRDYGGFLKIHMSRYLLKKASGVVYQTEEQKQYFDYLSHINSIIIPNAVRINVLQKKKVDKKLKDNRNKKLVAVGRLHSQKNYPMMISVMSKILKDYPDYQLCIYGDGDQKVELQRIIKRYGMESQILLCGVSKDIPYVLREAEIFLMTSEYEGISNALLEAMSEGVAVIATDCLGGGARILIQNRENGILVPRGDKVLFENAVRELLSDIELKTKLANNAKKVNELYEPEIIYRKWSLFIQNVVNES